MTMQVNDDMSSRNPNRQMTEIQASSISSSLKANRYICRELPSIKL